MRSDQQQSQACTLKNIETFKRQLKYWFHTTGTAIIDMRSFVLQMDAVDFKQLFEKRNGEVRRNAG